MTFAPGTSLLITSLDDGATSSVRLSTEVSPADNWSTIVTLNGPSGESILNSVRVDACVYIRGNTDYRWRLLRGGVVVVDEQINTGDERGTAAHPTRFTTVDLYRHTGGSNVYQLQARDLTQALTLFVENVNLSSNGTAVSAVLPAATGGTSPYTYQLLRDGDGSDVGSHDDGVSFNRGTRRVTVAANQKVSQTLRMVATDSSTEARQGSAVFVLTADTLEFLEPPGRVTGVRTVSTTTTSVTLTWDEPDHGSSGITTYQVQWRAGTQSYSSARSDPSPTTTTTITGLARGVSYDFRVRARARDGDGQWSADFSQTTASS